MPKPHGVSQYRPKSSDSGPLYSPERDFAYCWTDTLYSLAHAFAIDYWPQLERIIRDQLAVELGCEVTDQLIEEKMQATHSVFTNFLQQCCRDPAENLGAVFTRVGGDELPHACRAGWLAMLGAVYLGQMFAGLRDVNMQGDVPPRTARRELADIAKMRFAVQGIPGLKGAADQLSRAVRVAAEVGHDEQGILSLVRTVLAE